jgi:hypothetical protein
MSGTYKECTDWLQGKVEIGCGYVFFTAEDVREERAASYQIKIK